MDCTFIINCLETNNLDLLDDADLGTMCRTCTKQDSKDFRSVFESTEMLKDEQTGQIYHINEILHLLTRRPVFPDDGLPQRICRPCVKQLYTSFMFLRQATKIDRAFQTYLRTNNRNPEEEEENNIELQVSAEDKGYEKEEDGDELEDNLSQELPFEDTPQSPHLELFLVNQGNDKLVDRLIVGESIDSPPKASPPKRAVKRIKTEESVEIFLEIPRKKVKPAVKRERKIVKVIEENKDCAEGEKGQKSSNYECPTCHKTYSFLQSLNRHMHAAHTGTDRAKKECSYCDKTFTRADDLKRHIRTHTGERPYVCKVCSKSFKQSSELKEHELSHTKEAQFPCTICSRVLGTRMGFYYHMKNHESRQTGEGDVTKRGKKKSSP